MTKHEFLDCVSESDFSLPRTIKSLGDLPEPSCPDCLRSGSGSFLISAVPKRTGVRGNPILECRTCRRTFTYPKLSGGRHLLPPKIFLSVEHVHYILDNTARLGRTSSLPYMRALAPMVLNRKEVLALISLTQEEYQKFSDLVKTGIIVLDILAHFPQLNYELTSALVRAELSRSGYWD